MGSFPIRHTRAAIGPKLQNRFRIIDPRKEIGDESFNMAFWTVGAAGLMLPMARFICTQAGSADPVVTSHAEAYNPNGDGDAPVMDRTSAGVYPFDFVTSQYPDETETSRPLVLEGGIAVPLVAAFRHAQVEIDVDAISGTIRFWSDGGATPADCAKFMVILW
jgi:hypothetical protein